MSSKYLYISDIHILGLLIRYNAKKQNINVYVNEMTLVLNSLGQHNFCYPTINEGTMDCNSA